MKLKHLCNIRSGLVLTRKETKESDGYQYLSLNFRCIRSEGTIDLKEVDTYRTRDLLKNEYLTHVGDIIVRLTPPYTAVLIDSESTALVISSNFVVIRIKDDNLLPEFLTWFLNSKPIKRQLYINATSNVLGSLKSKSLSDLELVVPPLEIQKKIGQINKLSKHEIQLLQELTAARETYYASILDQIYNNIK